MEIGYIAFHYLEEFLKVFLLLFFVGGFQRKRRYNCIGVWGIGFIVLCVGIQLVNSKSVNSILIVGMVFVTNFILLEKKSLFYLVIFAEIIISFCDALIAGFVCMALGYNMDQALLSQGVSININRISLIFLLLLTLFLRKKGVKSKEEWFLKNKKIHMYIMLFIVGVAALCLFIIPIQEFSLFKIGGSIYRKPLIGATISGIVFIIIVIITIMAVYKKDQYKQKSIAYSAFINQQSLYYKEVIQREIETKKFRHDIANHLSYIKSCIDEGNEEKASQYIGQLTNITAELGGGYHTGNSTIDIIIRNTRLKERGIRLQWRGIFPEENRMEDMDICGLFGNLLDNAATSVEKCFDEKEITVDCKSLGSNVCIQIKNPIPKGVQIKFRKGLPLTTKNGSYHGYGVLNIVSIVEKYGGKISFRAEQGFAVEIVLLNILTSTGKSTTLAG